MTGLITEDEVNFLKTNPRHISWKDVSSRTGTVDTGIEQGANIIEVKK